MIIQAYHPVIGGGERQLASLAPLLQAREVEVSILTRRYPGMAPREVVNGIPVYRLPIRGSKPVAALSFTLSALRLLRQLKPDLIHAHELLSPTTTAMIGKWFWRTPILTTVLGGGELGDVSKVRRGKLGDFRAARIARQLDAFIVLSQEIDDEVASMGVPAERRYFIPNGVDAQVYRSLEPAQKSALRVSLGIPEGPVVVYTGRFEAEKRVNNLVQVWPQIRTLYPDASLVLVGDGSQKPRLMEMDTKGIYFPGRVDQVLPYLQAADVFVLPSAREGLSNSLIEAMAVGLPAVVTSVGGALDIIEDGVNGFLVAPDDLEGLRSGLAMVLGSSELRASAGAAARRKVEADYALSVAADQIRALYDNLLSAAGRKQGAMTAASSTSH
jgi:glycosyltransferase involved in cell wall biosynthesis